MEVFEQKYFPHQKDLFIRVATSLMTKQLVIDNNSVKIELLYDPQQTLSYSNTIHSEFIYFKPSPFVRTVLPFKLQQLADDPMNNLGICNDIRKIIEECPILTPYFLFTSVTCSSNNNKRSTFLQFLIDCALEPTFDDPHPKALLACLCTDFPVVIRGQHQDLLFSNYVCYAIVKTLSAVSLKHNFKVYELIAYLSNVFRFNAYCTLKLH